jgi:hypothetical protein
MELTLQTRYLLLALYDYRYNGKYYELGDVFSSHGITISRLEVDEIARSLLEAGLVRALQIENTLFVQISLDGVDYVEENDFFADSSYIPQDRLKPLERELVRHKLTALHLQLQATELGVLVTPEMLRREIEELDALLNILGKRSWLQILKGKVYEMSQESSAATTCYSILQEFESQICAKEKRISDEMA